MKVSYDVKVIIDGNDSNLNPRNLAPLGELDFERELMKGWQVNMNFIMDDEIVGVVYYRIVEIIKTQEADKLILLLVGRKQL